ncbi:MAG: FAD:protein FMN transferase [Lentisphaerales bacterium]|nr:FAD:protein FMN transferase [Lentisphaerales bacterium]
MFLGVSGNAKSAIPQKHIQHSHALGTEIVFTIFHEDAKLVNLAIDEALNNIEQVEKLMSIYRPDSQLSQLNREGILPSPHPVLVDVLKKAKELSALTNGAFDVTVQPLWNLFRKYSLKGSLPGKEDILKAKAKISWQFIDIQKDHICMNKAGAQITLNGIAQGLAADVAQKALKARGIEHALIDTGELNAVGSPHQKDAWKIGIQHSRKPGYHCKTILKNRCLSSSGDYQIKFSEDYRHHHLFNPQTGYSPTELANVSVLAPTAMEADALSTAVFILGLKKGKALIESLPDVDALFVTKEGRFEYTDQFKLA